MALGIAGHGARALKVERRSPERALDEYSNMLERGRSSLLEKPSPGYGRDDESLTMTAAIETSLELLDSRCNATGIAGEICFGEMYRGLGLMKSQARAPLSMLSKLWNVGRDDAEVIMGQLCIMSLADPEDHRYNVVRSDKTRLEHGLKIHDLRLEYCRKHCKEIS